MKQLLISMKIDAFIDLLTIYVTLIGKKIIFKL